MYLCTPPLRKSSRFVRSYRSFYILNTPEIPGVPRGVPAPKASPILPPKVLSTETARDQAWNFPPQNKSSPETTPALFLPKPTAYAWVLLTKYQKFPNSSPNKSKDTRILQAQRTQASPREELAAAQPESRGACQRKTPSFGTGPHHEWSEGNLRGSPSSPRKLKGTKVAPAAPPRDPDGHLHGQGRGPGRLYLLRRVSGQSRPRASEPLAGALPWAASASTHEFPGFSSSTSTSTSRVSRRHSSRGLVGALALLPLAAGAGSACASAPAALHSAPLSQARGQTKGLPRLHGGSRFRLRKAKAPQQQRCF